MKTPRRFITFILISILLLNLPSFAWDGVGHMAVAYVAYQHLTPAAKIKVEALLERNPYFKNKKWQSEIPAGTAPEDRDLLLFMIAATWPDEIKSDKDYTSGGAPGSGGNRPDGPDSARNTGYDDFNMHKYWHFVDTPFSDDHSKLPAIPTPNAETQIEAFRAVLASSTASDDLKSYDLVWLLHLVGDVHQPLHCSTRVSSSEPEGDQGGNKVNVTCGVDCNGATELHAVWDNALAAGSDPKVALAAAKTVPAADPKAAGNTHTAAWIKESSHESRVAVYIPPIQAGDGPFTITQQYEENVKKLGADRIALAGARLAKVINNELK
jgi:hypothetical protein